MQEQPPVSEVERPKGCLAKLQALGLAMYATLLLSFVAAGVICGLGAIYSLFAGSTTPRLGLVSGAEVEPWRLAEFRRLELLGQSESPALYHDSSIAGDGSSGCIVASGNLVAFTEGGASHTQVPLEDAQISSEPTPTGMVVALTLDNQTVSCQFFHTEEGTRFADMLKAEARLAKPRLPPAVPEATDE